MLAPQRLFILAGVSAVVLLGLIWHNFGQDKYSLRDITSMHSGISRYVPAIAPPPLPN
jgi:hypothetical protein